MRSSSIRSFALAVLLVTVAALPAARAFEPAPAALDRAALIARVISQVHGRFWDPRHLETIGWLDKANEARAAALAAPSDAAAIARINALLAETKASHIGLWGMDDLNAYILLDLLPSAPGAAELITRRFWGNRPHYPGIGAFTVEIGGRHFIDQVMDGSPAARAGLRTGDEIVDVAGAAYAPIRPFRPHLGQTVDLGVRRRADGPVERVPVAVAAITPGIAFHQATFASARVIAYQGLRIGYFRLWAQFGDAPIARTMARLSPGGQVALPERSGERNTLSTPVVPSDVLTSEPLDAMIVDLRGKVGGRDHSDLVLDLLEGPRRGVPYVYRGRTETRRETTPVRRNPSFRGRTAVLIDHHTRSAGELLANSLKAARIGPLIGTTTAGHVLATQIEVVAGDHVLQLPVSRPEADGLVLEGKGVDPDMIVEQALPYSAGADAVLEAALRDLAGRLQPARPLP
jgi:carboxyl-terminal processing protease